MPSNQIWISTGNAPFIHQWSVKGHKQGYDPKDNWKCVEHWIIKKHCFLVLQENKAPFTDINHIFYRIATPIIYICKVRRLQGRLDMLHEIVSFATASQLKPFLNCHSTI